MNEKLHDRLDSLIKNLEDGNYGQEAGAYLSSAPTSGYMAVSSKQYEKSVRDEYPGLEVAITHKLAPRSMQLTISTPKNEDAAYGLFEKADYKYIFNYVYLDLSFTIKTYDDKIAAKLYPYFNEEQKTQIMAMTLGSKVE